MLEYVEWEDKEFYEWSFNSPFDNSILQYFNFIPRLIEIDQKIIIVTVTLSPLLSAILLPAFSVLQCRKFNHRHDTFYLFVFSVFFAPLHTVRKFSQVTTHPIESSGVVPRCYKIGKISGNRNVFVF